VPLRERVVLHGVVGWQPSRVEIEDAGGTRDGQDLTVLHALLEAEFRVRGRVLVSGGAGALRYGSEELGLFAEGADISPLVRLGAGGDWNLGQQLVSVRALADLHQFGNPVLRSAGGSRGGVLRFGVQVGVVPGGAR
jgi:hypothetical protein